MDIAFMKGEKPEDWNQQKALNKRHGAARAKLIRRRLDDLYAAPTLATMRNLPGRCHELKGERAGQLSVDLDGPYRLVFQPTDPLPRKADGGLDWGTVVAIVVQEVADTHD
jgi:plasmid maintenance system killer protein